MAGITDDLNAIKTLQQGLVNNKVTRFAYEQSAYDNNEVAGQVDYVASRANNIPVDSPSIMQVNQTVVDKGFRARASSMPRMLLNHLFGRISYNLNKLNDLFFSALTSLASAIGQANGLVPLDSTGRIPYQYLPEDAIELKGTWNASTNIPTLVDGTGTTGDTYIVTVAGTQDLGSGAIQFFAGDRVIYNGSAWQRFASGSVQTVCEIAPDNNGNVNLALQTDLSKIFPVSFISMLLQPLIGLYWLESTGITNITFLKAYNANGLWVACSVNNGLWWSVDGKAWTQGTGDCTGYTFRTVYYADGIWVAGGDDGLWWSVDGKAWTIVDNPFIIKFEDFLCVYNANGTWVAGGDGGALFYSTNGRSWSDCDIGSSADPFVYDVTEVKFMNNEWILYSHDNMSGFYSSADGQTWTEHSLNIGSGFWYTREITFASNLYVVATAIVSGSNDIGLLWSTDGRTFNIAQSLTPVSQQFGISFSCVHFANGLWVAGSLTANGLWWSTDGRNWAQGTGGENYLFSSICYANNLWYAGTTQHGLWKSTDGINWTQMSEFGIATVVHDIIYMNYAWLALVGNTIWYSNWESTANVLAEGGTV